MVEVATGLKAIAAGYRVLFTSAKGPMILTSNQSFGSWGAATRC